MLHLDRGEFIRTVTLMLALCNQLLQAAGHPILPINEEDLQNFISALWTVLASLWIWFTSRQGGEK